MSRSQRHDIRRGVDERVKSVGEDRNRSGKVSERNFRDRDDEIQRQNAASTRPMENANTVVPETKKG
jgi:hypothetical protein